MKMHFVYPAGIHPPPPSRTHACSFILYQCTGSKGARKSQYATSLSLKSLGTQSAYIFMASNAGKFLAQ